MAKKKRTKKRKKPPGAGKDNTRDFSSKSDRARKLAVSKLKEIWPANPDFDFTDEIIKGLDDVAILQLEGNAIRTTGYCFV